MASDGQQKLTIREIESKDAEAAARLSGELGYPVSASELSSRIGRLARLPDHAVYVACQGDRVVGWMDIGVVHHLQSDPYAEIGGLVVDSNARNSGIGRELVRTAERWAKERSLAFLLVRSNVIREAAHRFYLRESFSRTKTSAVFVKNLR